jgi:hypothetical protein
MACILAEMRHRPEGEHMTTPEIPKTPATNLGPMRAFVNSIVLTIIVLGFAIVALAMGRSSAGHPAPVNALASSRDQCVVCHSTATPGIVEQYGRSKMAANQVSCRNCHEVDKNYPGATAHEGTYILASPTPSRCGQCHTQEVAQFAQSRHSAPAYAAILGVTEFSPAQLAAYQSIPEGTYMPDKTRHELYAIEGPQVTTPACHQCHDIGAPQPDDSIGKCQKCHFRHEFSLEQVRKPETCGACHIGPDHPQAEIYQESPHGITYATSSSRYHWTADPGTLTVNDFPAPTCASCHMSGFGDATTTHDVGDRLSWYLFAPVSEHRPSWQENQARMKNVCRQCHNEDFITGFYNRGDNLTNEVNAWVNEGNSIYTDLKTAGYLNKTDFDEPMDFVYFDLWHYYGRTAKFGTWMNGPDYTQWHGAYPMMEQLDILRDFARQKMGPDKYPFTSTPVSPSTAAPEGVH